MWWAAHRFCKAREGFDSHTVHFESVIEGGVLSDDN